MRRPAPTEDEVLTAWDELKAAIQRAECALPFQMTAAMALLQEAAKRMDDLLMRRAPKDPTP
jgi:hypothetical protein